MNLTETIDSCVGLTVDEATVRINSHPLGERLTVCHAKSTVEGPQYSNVFLDVDGLGIVTGWCLG